MGHFTFFKRKTNAIARFEFERTLVYPVESSKGIAMTRIVSLTVLLLALWCGPARAVGGGGSLPIPESGATIDTFLPPGYQIEQKEEVDLDGDGLRDAALLIVPGDCEAKHDSVQEQEQCWADGRMLVIVFRKPKGGFRLSVSKEIRSDVGNHGDHFDGMKVRGRTLLLGGGSFSCAGQVGDNWTSQYRYQDRDWFLIGERQKTWHRSTECDGGQFDQNRDFCPELKLGSSDVCLEVTRSANYMTSTQDFRWWIEPVADRDNKGRTVIIRGKFAREPLKRLADETFFF
jgi:hypothetical protein